MPGKIHYPLSEHFPYVPKEILLERIGKLSRRCSQTGCWIWTGTRQTTANDQAPGAPVMRVRRPGGKSLNILVHRVTYWTVHGKVPKEPFFLMHGCGDRSCIEPSHLLLTERNSLSNLTAEEVYAARLEYFGKDIPLRHRKNQERRSAISTCAEEIGLSMVTVERIVRGGRVYPSAWTTKGLTVDIVKQVYARHVETRELREMYAKQTPSVQSIAAKYGLAAAPCARMLLGISYRSVPMPPTSTNEARRRALSLYEIKHLGLGARPQGAAGVGSTRPPAAAQRPSVAQATG